MDIILIILLLHTIFRGIIFYKREEKWYKTLFPFFNKYTIGKLCDYKKIGLFTAITNFIFIVCFFIKYAVEFYITEQIYTNLPADTSNFVLEDIVKPEILQLNDIMLWVLVGSALVYFVFWVILMRKFSDVNGTSTWWMVVWGVLPTIAYLYYALISKKYYIPNEGLISYEIEKVPFKEVKSKVKKKWQLRKKH